jgi:hypothetical protein
VRDARLRAASLSGASGTGQGPSAATRSRCARAWTEPGLKAPDPAAVAEPGGVVTKNRTAVENAALDSLQGDRSGRPEDGRSFSTPQQNPAT